MLEKKVKLDLTGNKSQFPNVGSVVFIKKLCFMISQKISQRQGTAGRTLLFMYLCELGQPLFPSTARPPQLQVQMSASRFCVYLFAKQGFRGFYGLETTLKDVLVGLGVFEIVSSKSVICMFRQKDPHKNEFFSHSEK